MDYLIIERGILIEGNYLPSVYSVFVYSLCSVFSVFRIITIVKNDISDQAPSQLFCMN